MSYEISEQPTLKRGSVPNTLHAYLKAHGLYFVDVERATGVPCEMVWNASRGVAISREQAAKLRQGLYKMTRQSYEGPMKTF